MNSEFLILNYRSCPMPIVALSELIGATVRDDSGAARGRVREIAVSPQEHPTRVAFFIVRTPTGERVLRPDAIRSAGATVRATSGAAHWEPYHVSDGVLLLKRDLLDRQIIDVHGRKVVRVNDVELQWFSRDEKQDLRVREVEVGLRGAVRRLLLGVLPRQTLDRLARQIPARVIPWEFVDVIEVDPARRVKLKIEHERLAQLHPSDIADILEELAPAEREAILTTLDEEVAAEALEEVEPKLQK